MENNNIRLPIGSLVTVEGITQPLLIIGHEFWIEAEQKQFNYATVQFPIGFLPDGELHFINHEQVDDILNLGLLHPEHIELSDLLDMELKVGIYSELKETTSNEEEQEEMLEL